MPKPNVHNIILSFFIFHLSFFIISCSEDPPVFPKNHNITMTIDAEVLESWIELHVDGLKKDATYIVERDTIKIFEGKLDKADTLLHDENLQPNREYLYTVYAESNNEINSLKSEKIQTVDTTNYFHKIEEYDFSRANFTDCWIWDENNFWLTGYFYFDSSSDDGPYTILDFNNKSITPIAIKDYEYSAPVILPPPDAFWPISKNKVWFVKESLWKWTGGYANKFWKKGGLKLLHGLAENKLYAASNDGRILKITNDYLVNEILHQPDYNFTAMWGDRNDLIILSSVTSAQKIALHYLFSEDVIKEKTISDNYFPILSLWFKDKNNIFLAGDNIYTFKRDSKIQTFQLESNMLFTQIRGTAINNIYATTYDGKIYYFNGRNWKEIFKNDSIKFTSLAVSNNLIIAAGNSFIEGNLIILKY